MTLTHIKSIMKDYLNKEVVIDYDLGRNKNEIIKGKINKLYKYIFTVELPNGDIKSFSYADVITKTVKISIKS